jgi:hypothetical protein
MKVLESLKSLSPLEIGTLVLFIIFVIFPFKLPFMLAGIFDSSIGLLLLFVIAIYLFFYTNPILGVIFILVAYELIRRSSNITGSVAMAQYGTTQSNKNVELKKLNPPRETTLEEEVIQKMAPAQNNFIKGNSGSDYKPVMDSKIAASLF